MGAVVGSCIFDHTRTHTHTRITLRDIQMRLLRGLRESWGRSWAPGIFDHTHTHAHTHAHHPGGHTRTDNEPGNAHLAAAAGLSYLRLH